MRTFSDLAPIYIKFSNPNTYQIMSNHYSVFKYASPPNQMITNNIQKSSKLKKSSSPKQYVLQIQKVALKGKEIKVELRSGQISGDRETCRCTRVKGSQFC